MRAVIQRVRRAAVTVDTEEIGRIGPGLLVLLGVTHDDTEEDVRVMADKLANLRLFADAAGKMNLSATDVEAEFLVVSQFTLYGDARRGRRPSFTAAAPPALAEKLYEDVVSALRERGFHVATGRFGASMDVSLTNDGPVTLLFDTP